MGLTWAVGQLSSNSLYSGLVHGEGSTQFTGQLVHALTGLVTAHLFAPPPGVTGQGS